MLYLINDVCISTCLFYFILSNILPGCYNVPPEFVEEDIDEFLFVRNDEDLQHAI